MIELCVERTKAGVGLKTRRLLLMGRRPAPRLFFLTNRPYGAYHML